MKDIAIYGAGGFGREVACLINLQNEENKRNDEKLQWNLMGFFDDNPALKDSNNEYGKVLGGKDELNAWDKPLCVLMAIGSGSSVEKIVKGIHNDNIEFPNFFFKASYADEKNVRFGKGNIVINSHLSCAVEMGDFNVMNGSVVFGHDVKVGSYNTFMPAVRISGEVKIGNDCFFGVASIVLQQLTIGDRVKLGAGSVMMTKPKNDSLYIGNPAKLFKY